jgi:hypothetical protein
LPYEKYEASSGVTWGVAVVTVVVLLHAQLSSFFCIFPAQIQSKRLKSNDVNAGHVGIARQSLNKEEFS